MDYENNLFALLKELKTRTYKPGRSICFAVKEPSMREIFAADFRDRVVHHLLINEILDFFEKRFVRDSFACRPGKGTHRAVKHLKKQIKLTKARKFYYGQFDIKSFFMSIDHNILYAILERGLMNSTRNWEFGKSGKRLEEILWLAKVIIFHRSNENYLIKGDRQLLAEIPPHKSLLRQNSAKGLPIGNYSSQFFANLYMNEFDQFIKRNLKCLYYVRYVDDFIILEKNAERLIEFGYIIDDWLGKNLGLSLNLKKTRIQPLERGIDFLGYFIKPDIMYPRRKVVKRYKNKLYPIALGTEKTDLRSLMAMVNSYAGHFGV